MTGGRRAQGHLDSLPRLSPAVVAGGARRVLLALLLTFALVPTVQAADGWASQYGPGTGVAMSFCTWTLRHTAGCGWVRIQSLDTGIVVRTRVVDYCFCRVPGSSHPLRIVDLQYGVRAALGLDPSLGLWRVQVERVSRARLPNTSTE